MPNTESYRLKREMRKGGKVLPAGTVLVPSDMELEAFKDIFEPLVTAEQVEQHRYTPPVMKQEPKDYPARQEPSGEGAERSYLSDRTKRTLKD